MFAPGIRTPRLGTRRFSPGRSSNEVGTCLRKVGTWKFALGIRIRVLRICKIPINLMRAGTRNMRQVTRNVHQAGLPSPCKSLGVSSLRYWRADKESRREGRQEPGTQEGRAAALRRPRPRPAGGTNSVRPMSDGIETTVELAWVAARLKFGSAQYLSNELSRLHHR